MSDQSEAEHNLNRASILFANGVFVSGLLASIYAVCVMYIPIHGLSFDDPQVQNIRLTLISIGLTSIAFFGFALRLKDGLKANLSALVTATILSLYLVETCLDIFQKIQEMNGEEITAQHVANKMGIPFDDRTKFEVLDDLRADGIDAYPNVHSSVLLAEPSTRNGIKNKENGVFPVGGISNKMMVQSNENGYWMMYEGDEFGFNNPKGMFKNDDIDIVMTGDSFVEGWSVKPNENIGAILRDFGFNVISLGKSGNGPLLEYVALREYAESVKPKVVLWFYFLNDYDELQMEMKSSHLMKYYYDDKFSQNLMGRQNEINETLINFIENEETIWRNKAKELEQEKENFRTRVSAYWLLKRSLKSKNFELTSIRKRLGLSPLRKPFLIKPEPILFFKNILQKTDQLVSKWGGKLYFVYLPDRNKHSPISYREKFLQPHVLNLVSGSNLPIINIDKEVFASRPDPLTLYPLRMMLHYNAAGYRLVAETINKRLTDDGFK